MNMGEINGNNGKNYLLENKDIKWYLFLDDLSIFEKDLSEFFLRIVF